LFYVDDAIKQLKVLLSFFGKYKENKFKNALTSADDDFEMNIEPKFCKKRIRRRNK